MTSAPQWMRCSAHSQCPVLTATWRGELCNWGDKRSGWHFERMHEKYVQRTPKTSEANQRPPPDGARVRSFHDLHTVVDIITQKMIIRMNVNLCCLWVYGQSGSPSHLLQNKQMGHRIQQMQWEEIGRTWYRPSWIYVTVYISLCSLKCLCQIIHNNCQMWL